MMMLGQLEVFLAENVRGLTMEPHKKDFHEAIQILQEAGYAFNSVDSHCVISRWANVLQIRWCAIAF